MLRYNRITIITCITLIITIANVVLADLSWRQNSHSKAAKIALAGEQCVLPTPWMRRNHMELLKHDRYRTVHMGIRTLNGSLSKCIGCHVNKDTIGNFIPINNDNQFCATCHQYTNIMVDCFQCHSAVPTK